MELGTILLTLYKVVAVNAGRIAANSAANASTPSCTFIASNFFIVDRHSDRFTWLLRVLFPGVMFLEVCF